MTASAFEMIVTCKSFVFRVLKCLEVIPIKILVWPISLVMSSSLINFSDRTELRGKRIADGDQFVLRIDGELRMRFCLPEMNRKTNCRKGKSVLKLLDEVKTCTGGNDARFFAKKVFSEEDLIRGISKLKMELVNARHCRLFPAKHWCVAREIVLNLGREIKM